MKKIYHILSFVAVSIILFTSCNPTKDFQEEYDLYNNPLKVKFADSVSVYTLNSVDYASSSVSSINQNKCFSESYPASSYLLEILNKKYNAKISASVTVVYNYSNPLTLHDSVSYALADTSSEYGNKYKDFSVISDLYSYLSKNYPQATRGKVVTLTYNWYVTAITVVTNSFVCLGGNSWTIVTSFSLADYKVMGQSYANFSSTADAKNIIPIYLKNAYLPYAKVGDNVMIQYAVYNSATKLTTQYIQPYTYNGTLWAATSTINTKNIVVNFDGLTWKFPPQVKMVFTTETPSNAISYTLSATDYTLAGSKYADFDRRAGQSEGDDNVFLNKIGLILKTKFAATIAVNQVYAVTYADYSGTNPAPNKTIYVKVSPL